jgi:hypothetical protein
MELAADITVETRNAVLAELTSSLATAAAAGELALGNADVQPRELAEMIIATMDGIKHNQGIGPELEQGTRLFMRLLKAAVRRPDR